MMKKIGFLVVVAALAVGLFAMAGVVFAQDPVDETVPVPPCGMAGGAWRWGGSGGALSVVADLLGMTQEDLLAELREGASIVDLTNEAGISPQELIEGIMSSRIERLQAAVDAGRLTQEQADAMVETMRERITDKIESDEFGLNCGTGLNGKGFGRMGGRMMNRAFIDQDGDGICDYGGTDQGTWRGKGRMFGGSSSNRNAISTSWL